MRIFKYPCVVAIGFVLFTAKSPGADLAITALERNGRLSWTNAFTNGICTLEAADRAAGPWAPLRNTYTAASGGTTPVIFPSGSRFYRLLAVDISTNEPRRFENLVQSYGCLRTIAGNGAGSEDNSNYWHSRFEGQPATQASLSRPHCAMASESGNIFIVDICSHSVLMVSKNGTLHTVAGTHVRGNGPDYAAPGTNVDLDSPNGLWVRRDGTVYILDTGNGKVRKLNPNGEMKTVVDAGSKIEGGRGLCVSEDERQIYVANGTSVLKCTPTGLIEEWSGGFVDLGNLVLDPSGNVVVTDEGANRVYRINANGRPKPIAGNGYPGTVQNGRLALKCGLEGVRGIWFLPNTGYLLATQGGSQIIYVDPDREAFVFLDGSPDGSHTGDDAWFYTEGKKISEPRSVTVDYHGNILIVENDAGYVRQIDFLRHAP